MWLRQAGMVSAAMVGVAATGSTRRVMMVGMQVADGVHTVEGLRVGNAYLVETSDGLFVVDTGMTPGVARRVLTAIDGHRRTPDPLRTIVLTHGDIDHVGGAAGLARRTGAVVAIHEADAAVLAGEVVPEGGLVMRAICAALRFRPVTPDRLLHDGDTVSDLRVVHVPGRTPGSIALVRADGVVFSGDALLADRRGRVKPPDPRLARDPSLAAASAERIADLCFRLLLPGHGAPASV
jgi:glyoxylase-like metal-dependent hydrolase (beta-lactamase superfamily II)